jgi:Fibronectin type III domain
MTSGTFVRTVDSQHREGAMAMPFIIRSLRAVLSGCATIKVVTPSAVFVLRRTACRVGLAVLAVSVAALELSGCLADPPPIIMRGASPGDGRAVVSWQPPTVEWFHVTAYVVTPWIGFVRQAPVVFKSTAVVQTVPGLRNGVPYTFSVHAVDAHGDSAESGMSNQVIPGPRIASGRSRTGAGEVGGSRTPELQGPGSWLSAPTPSR